MNQDTLIRVYSRLLALKENLPKYSIKETFVKDYHEIIALLSAETGTTLDEFKIPDNQIKHEVRSYWPSIPSLGQTAGRTYSDDRYCERGLFLSKLGALLSYFQIAYLSKGEDKKKVGFQPPEE